MIGVEIRGDSAVVARLEALPEKMRQGLARAIAQRGFSLQRKRQFEKPSGQTLKVQTGALRSSAKARIEDHGDEVSATLGAGVAHARLYGFGGLHPWLIQMRRAKALRFEVGGRAWFRIGMPSPPGGLALRSALAEITPEVAAKAALRS